ncbi:hypothetical protein Ae201684P_000111 [Aphanomyces euteiches]|uniref:DDE Tnp4 domain-containing protein n=1 Tax=Aphanomyces euteiches TaxID=100861 RepID=A0A6G0XSB2_9STRA|nr:hypothetical protein Ae201684_001966 [Aphanomyces euteiches]KAH9086689.1 hypothetical protein Ae201684P_000111 [Aphanomyces euteiches]
MEIAPVLCTITVIAVAVALVDGRENPSVRMNDFVGSGQSVWPAVRADSGMDGWFLRYLRCSRKTFFAIAHRLSISWTQVHPPTHVSSRCDVVDRLAITMYYLTHCDGLDCVALIFVIGKTKAYEHILEIVLLIQHAHLSAAVALPSSAASWSSIASGFESVSGFPNVYGAIDGCLVMIKRFRQHEGWYCRKGFPAFNLMALVDDKKRFMAYSLRPGSQNDRMVFKNSMFGKSRVIPNGGYILADAGYTLLPHVLTPFPIVLNMKKCKAHYNSRTRTIVEQSIGLWKNKFRLFKKPLEFHSPKSMARVIEATLVLHNWIIDLDSMHRTLSLGIGCILVGT